MNICFSIVIAVRNGAKTLQRCLDSIASQKYRDFELIVIDGGSTDGTVSILELNTKLIKYWVSESDAGISDAWNKGISVSHGQWLYFLGADDFFWDDLVLQRMADVLRFVPSDCCIAYGKVVCVNESGVAKGEYGAPWEVAKITFMVDMSIPHQGVFHKSILFKEKGFFDLGFRFAADYEFLLRCVPLLNPVFFDGIIAGMQIGGLSSNVRYAPKIYKEFANARVKNGFSGYSWLWFWRYSKSVLKAIVSRLLGEGAVKKMLSVRDKFFSK